MKWPPRDRSFGGATSFLHEGRAGNEEELVDGAVADETMMRARRGFAFGRFCKVQRGSYELPFEKRTRRKA